MAHQNKLRVAAHEPWHISTSCVSSRRASRAHGANACTHVRRDMRSRASCLQQLEQAPASVLAEPGSAFYLGLEVGRLPQVFRSQQRVAQLQYLAGPWLGPLHARHCMLAGWTQACCAVLCCAVLCCAVWMTTIKHVMTDNVVLANSMQSKSVICQAASIDM